MTVFEHGAEKSVLKIGFCKLYAEGLQRTSRRSLYRRAEKFTQNSPLCSSKKSR